MRLIRMLLVSALAFSAIPAHADSKDVARLTQLLEKSQTLTARFSQLTLDGGGTQLQETAGEMAVQRPGLFYWKTDAPNEQTIVSDGQNNAHRHHRPVAGIEYVHRPTDDAGPF